MDRQPQNIAPIAVEILFCKKRLQRKAGWKSEKKMNRRAPKNINF